MLLHYPQHTLSTHYQSAYDIPSCSSLHFPTFNLPPSTSLHLPQRPRRNSHRSMPTSQHSSNPTVRVHKSTPSPGIGAQSNNSQLMLAQGAFLGSGWGSEGYSRTGYLDTTPRQTGRYHKRLSSASSVNTTGPPSPHDHSSPFCHIANTESANFSPLENFDCASTPLQSTFSKSLPTPVGTPTSNSFMQPGYQNAASAQDNQRYSASAMGRIHSGTGDDSAAPFEFSAPPSASSMTHNSPATPLTNYDADYDEKNFSRGENIHSDMDSSRRMGEYLPFDSGYPQSAAFSQAMQDVFPDQMYSTPASQNFSHPSQPNMPHTSSHLSPYRTMNLFANRLQAANQDHISQRTNSPVTAIVRERSPFKPYNNNNNIQNLGRASHQNPMTAMTQAMMGQPQAPTAPKSVSPKELMLEDPEVDDADTTPLFPQRFDQPPSFVNRIPEANLPPFSDQNGMFNSQQFPAPPMQVPQQYPFVSSRRRQPSDQSNESDQVPEFPAHMISMETTMEEGPSESSQRSNHQQATSQIQRPGDTSSDSGTYTCTYHGCTLRFESPAKLQKHKRESHRQTSPSTGPASAPAGPTDLGLRNSQAGPHKCARINPSTGKPCNSIFSRPYDLTRHEDTIHNARKQKVRCHLCAEEKTFSRNDALTRHMRVVHPDVDWPGKTRRGKGRESS